LTAFVHQDQYCTTISWSLQGNKNRWLFQCKGTQCGCALAMGDQKLGVHEQDSQQYSSVSSFASDISFAPWSHLISCTLFWVK